MDYAADKVKSLEIDLKGGKSLKKVLSCFLALLLSACFMGCSGNAEIKEKATYAVVEISDGTKVDDLFEFESISKTSLNGELSKLGVDKGCYCIGVLQSGVSVVWRADDDAYGYDDGLFVYVDGEVTDAQIITYAAKLKETPISYESFKEKYN